MGGDLVDDAGLGHGARSTLCRSTDATGQARAISLAKSRVREIRRPRPAASTADRIFLVTGSTPLALGGHHAHARTDAPLLRPFYLRQRWHAGGPRWPSVAAAAGRPAGSRPWWPRTHRARADVRQPARGAAAGHLHPAAAGRRRRERVSLPHR